MPRKKRPTKLVTLDTETIGLDGELKRIAIYDGEKVHYGYTFGDIVWRLNQLKKDYKVHIYVHNLDFDARKIPEIFEYGCINWWNTKILGRKYTKIAHKDFTLHDSFKLLPMSLAKLSKEFNLTHGKVDLWEEVQQIYPFQYKSAVDFLNRCHPDDPLYLKYLGYDVISLYELIEKLCEVSTIPFEKLVNCLSTASMSKYVFKNGYAGKPFRAEGNKKTDYEILTGFKMWGTDKPVRECPDITYKELEYKIRESYFGGRTEVFTLKLFPNNGKITGFHYDVNSLYPDRCQNELFPVGFPKFFGRSSAAEYQWNKWLRFKKGLGFLKCTVYVPKQFIPPLPSHIEKLCFLTGYLKGTWTFIELEYAIKNCGVKIVEYEELILFENTFKVYERYMKVFTDMKEKASNEGNSALRFFCKAMSNNAYGWTGMRRDDKTQLDDISKIDKYDEKDIVLINDDLGYIESFADVKSDSIQVQIASYVTSYARIKLLDMLRRMSEQGKVYYCDTDSIVCEKPMPAEFVDPSKLGFWGLESELYEGLFLQPKVYTEVIKDKEKGQETKYKFKGITKDTQKTFTFKFYEDIYNAMRGNIGGQIVIETDRESLPSLIVAQKKGIDPNTLKITDKKLNLENKPKRRILFEENTTEAYHINSIADFERFTFRNNIKSDIFVRRTDRKE